MRDFVEYLELEFSLDIQKTKLIYLFFVKGESINNISNYFNINYKECESKFTEVLETFDLKATAEKSKAKTLEFFLLKKYFEYEQHKATVSNNFHTPFNIFSQNLEISRDLRSNSPLVRDFKQQLSSKDEDIESFFASMSKDCYSYSSNLKNLVDISKNFFASPELLELDWRKPFFGKSLSKSNCLANWSVRQIINHDLFVQSILPYTIRLIKQFGLSYYNDLEEVFLETNRKLANYYERFTVIRNPIAFYKHLIYTATFTVFKKCKINQKSGAYLSYSMAKSINKENRYALGKRKVQKLWNQVQINCFDDAEFNSKTSNCIFKYLEISTLMFLKNCDLSSFIKLLDLSIEDKYLDRKFCYVDHLLFVESCISHNNERIHLYHKYAEDMVISLNEHINYYHQNYQQVIHQQDTNMENSGIIYFPTNSFHSFESSIDKRDFSFLEQRTDLNQSSKAIKLNSQENLQQLYSCLNGIAESYSPKSIFDSNQLLVDRKVIESIQSFLSDSYKSSFPSFIPLSSSSKHIFKEVDEQISCQFLSLLQDAQLSINTSKICEYKEFLLFISGEMQYRIKNCAVDQEKSNRVIYKMKQVRPGSLIEIKQNANYLFRNRSNIPAKVFRFRIVMNSLSKSECKLAHG